MLRAAVLAAFTAAVLPGAAGAASLPSLPYREAPLELPAPGASAAAARSWIVAARPGLRSQRLADAAGARPTGLDGTYRLPAADARAFAARLRRAGLLVYAEADPRLRRHSTFEGAADTWARGAVVPPALRWPTPGGVSIAVIDDTVDVSHPDLAGHTTILGSGRQDVVGPHGTQVASAAAAAADGQGVLGVWPGAPIASYGLSAEPTCTEVSSGVLASARAKARVINLSLGTTSDCFTLFRAVQLAYGAGSLVVAAAGNDFRAGNPVTFPAAYPHVLSVAALGRDLRPSSFSTANAAVDLSAPGEDVPVAIPRAFDRADGRADGVTTADGTSFAAPMVAGGAAWVMAARPTAQVGQVADLLRRSANDVGAPRYDASTGYGLLDVADALGRPLPPLDPGEPNDGIAFVDGTAFSRADPYIWRGRGSGTLRATVDRVEDPVDVYRIRVPARSRARVRVVPAFGDPDLGVFSGAARRLSDARRLIGVSRRGTGRTDAVTVTNRGRRPMRAYVAILVSEDSRSLDAGYRLSFSRSRLR